MDWMTRFGYVCALFIAMVIAQPANAVPQELAYFLPAPALESDLEAYHGWLHSSEEQKQFVRARYDEYLARWQAIVQESAPRLDELSRIGGAQFTAPIYHPHATRTYADLKAEEQRVTQSLAEVDERLLKDWSSVVAEPQQPAVERIRAERARRRCGHDDRFVPASSIDVTHFLRDLQRAHPERFQLTEDADAILREHEARITPVVVELDTAVRRMATELQDIEYARQLETVQHADPDVINEINRSVGQQVSRLLRKNAIMQQHVSQANMRAIESVAALYDAPGSGFLVAEWRASVFPELFPDRCHCEDLAVDLLAAAAELNTADLIRDLVRTYRQEYEAFCVRLIEQQLQWKAQMAETRMAEGFAEYARRMQQLRTQRCQSSDEFLKRALALIAPGEMHHRLARRRMHLQSVQLDYGADHWPTP